MSVSILQEYRRVTRRYPCPICGHDHWCLVSRDGARCICPRHDNGRRVGDAGFLHRVDERLAGELRRIPATSRKWTPVETPLEAMGRFQNGLGSEQLQAFAADLGVDASALLALSMGCHGDAAAFPMLDGPGRVVGVRFRAPDGRKWALLGSKNGLFYATGVIRAARVYVCEGPTDTAAMLTAGLSAVGRADCSSGAADLKALFRRFESRPEVVIVADHDGPGVRGAESLADELSGSARSVRVIEPIGAKDAREWVRRGATAARIEAVANNAGPWVARKTA